MPAAWAMCCRTTPRCAWHVALAIFRRRSSSGGSSSIRTTRPTTACLNGASPNGGGLGGSINLLPKRAPNEPLNRVTFGVASGGQTQVAADIARRFGPGGNAGIRVNAAARNGGTAVDHEDVQLGLLAVGLDWRSRDVRLSGDIGWHDHH